MKSSFNFISEEDTSEAFSHTHTRTHSFRSYQPVLRPHLELKKTLMVLL